MIVFMPRRSGNRNLGPAKTRELVHMYDIAIWMLLVAMFVSGIIFVWGMMTIHKIGKDKPPRNEAVKESVK